MYSCTNLGLKYSVLKIFICSTFFGAGENEKFFHYRPSLMALKIVDCYYPSVEIELAMLTHSFIDV